MSLTIVSVAYPFCRVSADSVGGAEQILATLDRAIVHAGHRSVVIACSGSRIAGELVPIPEEPFGLDAAAVARVHGAVARALVDVVGREHVDVVHMHGVDFDRYLPPPGPAALATLHLPPRWYAHEALAPPRPHTYLTCVSFAQHATLPSWAAPAEVIENGIVVDTFRPRTEKASYCLMLARICPEKGIDDAILAAREAGVPLLIGGEVSAWDAHRRYFEEVVRPRVHAPDRLLGSVGLARKRRLLAGARSVLVPSRAPETSSLVAMEALASGTPVIAYRIGALPRIIEDGKTGFIVDDVHGMAEAIRRASEISPTDCRRAAETRFSAKVMTDHYLDLYERLARRPRHARSPLAVEEVHGLASLSALEREWAHLWTRCPTATPFQRPEWLLAYARAFCGEGSGAEAWAIVVRRGEEIVGIAPLCTRRTDEGAVISLLGEGVSDYLDIVVDADARAPSTSEILRALAHRSAEGPVLLGDLRAGSPLLEHAAPDSVVDEITVSAVCPYVPLDTDIDPLPRTTRETIRYYVRRANERLGSVTFEHVSGDAASHWLDVLFELHRARWSSRGEAGVLARDDVQRFHHDAIPALARAGHARLHGMTIGGRPAAAVLVLYDRGTAYSYITGMDPQFAGVSPGILLIGEAIDHARARGERVFDTLRGQEAYKYRFGAKDRQTHARRLLSATRARDASAASSRHLEPVQPNGSRS